MKKTFGWSGVYFIFMLYNCYVPTIPSFFTAKIASQTSKRHLSACNIWTFSRRFSRNLTPRAPKKYFKQYLCFIYFNNLVKYFSGARLRRCLISLKTVEISRAKFHEIQKTNNAHDVTMTSNTYRFCWKQVLTSKLWCRL
jgi:hypothetical protein